MYTSPQRLPPTLDGFRVLPVNSRQQSPAFAHESPNGVPAAQHRLHLSPTLRFVADIVVVRLSALSIDLTYFSITTSCGVLFASNPCSQVANCGQMLADL